ncbi:MAG: DUF1501 domain-containing protein, partial [Chloroflexota bacterium]
MLTRRDFLRRGVVVVSAGLALPPIFTRGVYAAANEGMLAAATNNRVLVIVQMAGGNDGLNMVVPFGDSSYFDLRRTVRIPAEQALPLDGGTGLHPSMGKLKELWDSGALAVVQGVGYPNPNLSHFRSMEIWQTANLNDVRSDGWVGKYFDRVIDENGHVIDGVAVGQGTPMALRSSKAAVAVVQNLETYRILPDPAFPQDTDPRVNLLLNMYKAYPRKAPYAALLSHVAEGAQRSSEALRATAKDYKPAIAYPTNGLGNGFKLLAQAISGDLGVKVFHIGLGGFDTHAGELNAQSRLLQQLSDGLHAFYRDLEAHGRAQDVLVMTWSEFGRRAQENANAGTDHGTAAPLFLIGGQVQRGLYGEAPNLTALDNGNLRHTVDFRSVYATVLDQWLGAPADDVLGGRFERLPFIGAAVGGVA